MNFLKNLFRKKQAPIRSNQEFWSWFLDNQQSFYHIIKSGKDPETGFFDQLSQKLDELKPDIYFLAGMLDKERAELILTPEGVIKDIAFIEELVADAPELPNWKFTALKPAMDIANVRIDMNGYTYDHSNLSFYAIDHPDYPDEVDIVMVYDQYSKEDESTITHGIYLFLDNYLGELNAVTEIDNLKVMGRETAEKELIPVSKLKDYLNWREKEFVEKYEGVRHNTENDSYSTLEGTYQNGWTMIAVVNSSLMEWDSKASHPWMLIVEINYNGDDNNGLPDKSTYELLNQFEEEMMEELRDYQGYLNLGRQTGNNKRTIYMACKEFRKPSTVLHRLVKKYEGALDLSFSIHKDKYWQTVENFRQG
ncbi:DUF695 domain-containing protein [Flavihumibacter rivuli]|uniref:DUF695 domain-containing protein n=1 Tax=Flavihumibacter rivuli TaxID=2838156 RepID=UPI001BDE8F3B|nr:DUF695 domain-containing protein [Flavihumibacter rivuli]ULQ55481.1 DUF695 domain-containing protein [Flavihumibacter rivuli]